MFFQMVTLTPSFSFTLFLGSFLNVDSPAQLNNNIRQPARKSLSAPVPLVPAAFFVGDDDDDDDKRPLGGNISAFQPFLTTTPLPLLLQKELAAGCQCHCRQ